MQSFLGMVNFLNRYSPQLAELSTSLRQLCRLHADYKPELENHHSFNAIKNELSTKIVLPYYDPTSHTIQMELLSNLQAEPSPLQNPTIRTLNVRH